MIESIDVDGLILISIYLDDGGWIEWACRLVCFLGLLYGLAGSLDCYIVCQALAMAVERAQGGRAHRPRGQKAGQQRSQAR